MIFIAGIQPKTRRIDDNPRTCSSCGFPCAYLTRIDHYLSLFFIPILPVKHGIPTVRCESCGAAFTETGQGLWTEETIGGVKRCPNCGQAMEHGFSYCPHCGTRLE